MLRHGSTLLASSLLTSAATLLLARAAHADAPPGHTEQAPVAAEPATSIEAWEGYGCWASWPAGGYARVDCPEELDGAQSGSALYRDAATGACQVHRTEEGTPHPAKCPKVMTMPAQPGVAPDPHLGRVRSCGLCALGSAGDRDAGDLAWAACCAFALVATCALRRRSRATSPCRGTP